MSFISGLNKNCFFKQKTLSCDLCFIGVFGDAENFKLVLSKITKILSSDSCNHSFNFLFSKNIGS